MTGYGNRLSRGRTYARTGRIHDLAIGSGGATARATGSRATPYRVRIGLSPLSDDTWRRAIAAMAAQAQFAATLLDGRMPEDIDTAFRAAGGSLFPARSSEIDTSCSCPDWANPCKHVAATHYVLADAFDRDPFLLFELRGRSRAAVLDALRAARAGAGDEPAAEGAAETPPTVPRVSLARLPADAYDALRAPLPALHLSLEAPLGGALLGQLGLPEGWTSGVPPADLFRQAGEIAHQRSLDDPEAP